MTQSELAARLGYSRSLVAALELDQRLPDIDAVVNAYIPALGLQDSRELAIQLVEQAAQARREHPPAAFLVEQPRHRSVAVEDTHSPHRIPVAPTELLGRDREIDIVCDRFLEQNTRLLTLVGPPGVGKTRLAQAAAARLQGFFAEGACIVPLAGVTNPELVVPSLMTAVGVTHSFAPGPGGPALKRLLAHLRHKEILLLLDNFEQILPAAPQMAHLLAECARVRLLVTSRERLHLRAEHLVRVPPLPLPAAVDLFVQRAAATDAELALAEGHRDAIEAICKRLDCLPLSIELCAAQVDFYTPQQLLQRVQSRPLDTLSGGAADLPPHQRTLRTAIQASWDLLSGDERSLMQTLSVFAGGCDPAMAEEVYACGPECTADAVSSLLRALAAKNLLHVETTAAGDRRLIVLESIREYAREHLEREGDAETLRERHFGAVLRFVRKADQNLRQEGAALWARRLDLELDNIRAALRWSYETARYRECAWLLLAIQFYWHMRGLLEEAADWAEQLIPHGPELEANLHMGILVTFVYKAVGLNRRDRVTQVVPKLRELVDACDELMMKSNAWRWLAKLEQDEGGAAGAYQQAIKYAREGRTRPETTEVFGIQVDRVVMLPKCLLGYAEYLADHARTAESTLLTHEALEHYRASGDLHGAAFAVGNLGRLALLEGDVDGANAHFQQAVDAAHHMDSIDMLCAWQPRLALTTLYLGDVEEARRLLLQIVDACREFGAPWNIARAADYLAEVELRNGNAEEAGRWLAESLAYEVEPQDCTVSQIQRLLIAARIAAAMGEDARAARMFGLADAMASRIQFEARDPMWRLAESSMAQVRARLDEPAFGEAYENGRQLPFDEALLALALPG